jgi:hypothetical protein
MVCDGCSTVLDGGSREQMTQSLAGDDGRAFEIASVGGLKECAPTMVTASRHLCARCVDAPTFADGSPVPPRRFPQ